jgi:Spy/CpxP family protein refolding chaperone
LVLAAAVVALVASPAMAQRQRQPRGGGGFGPAALLSQESVQKELKLSDDQVKKVKDLGEKSREAFSKLRDLDREERTKKMQEINKETTKALSSILTKDQSKRLREINLQVQGTRAFNNPEVAKELNITDEQKKQLQDLNAGAREEITKIFQGEGSREEKAKKMAEFNKAQQAKALKVLTSEQQKKWKEMTGKAFTGQIRTPFGGGGRRPRRDN